MEGIKTCVKGDRIPSVSNMMKALALIFVVFLFDGIKSDPLDCSIYQSDKEVIQSLPYILSINPTSNSQIGSYAMVDYYGSLTDLTLTMVSSIPSAIFCLRSLKTLTIQYGKELTISPDIVRLKSTLTALNLIQISSNLTLPRELFDLTALNNISIVASGVNKIPDEISQLTDLHALDLSGNQLTSLPETIAELNRLFWITLDGNTGLTSLDSLNNMAYIRILSAINCSIDHFPQNVSSVGVLNLAGNKLTSWENAEVMFADFTTEINLSNNQFSAFSPVLLKAVGLKTLDLSNNALVELSPFAYVFKNLEAFRLQGNQFSEVEKEWIRGRFRFSRTTIVL